MIFFQEKSKGIALSDHCVHTPWRDNECAWAILFSSAIVLRTPDTNFRRCAGLGFLFSLVRPRPPLPVCAGKWISSSTWALAVECNWVAFHILVFLDSLCFLDLNRLWIDSSLEEFHQLHLRKMINKWSQSKSKIWSWSKKKTGIDSSSYNTPFV